MKKQKQKVSESLLQKTSTFSLNTLLKPMRKFAVLLLFFGLYNCQEEPTFTEEEEAIEKNNNASQSTNQPAYVAFPNVSYNSAHDVLVFNSVEDINQLYDYLRSQNPYDRGNTVIIKSKLDEILANGYKYGSPANGRRVQLEDVERLLEESYPLSDETVTRILELNNQIQLPGIFLRNILTENTPFTAQNRKIIENSNNMQGNIKQTIINKDENDLESMDPVFADFLNRFPGYNSLYEKMINRNIQDLQSGMNPSSPQYNDNIISRDFDRLVRNEKLELFITEEGLFKAYTRCKEIHMKIPEIDAAYSELATTVDGDGNVDVPVITETNAGVDIAIIHESIPEAYQQFDPAHDDPFADETDDIYYDTALQTINTDGSCPKSNFIYNLYTTDNFLDVEFLNTTDLNDNPDVSIRRYWTFGDGTGSFLKNPTHLYENEGVYTVTLTSFSLDCACWHRHTAQVYVMPYLTRGGNPSCEIFPSISFQGEEPGPVYVYEASVNPDTDPDTPGNTIDYVDWELQKYNTDGVPEVVATQTTYTLNAIFNITDNGTYFVVANAFWEDGCFSPHPTTDFSVTGELEDCCDLKDKEKEATLPVTAGGEQYYLEYKDIVRGRGLRRAGGQERLYRKNGSGKYRTVKAIHGVVIEGEGFDLDGYSNCTTTSASIGSVDAKETRFFMYGNFNPLSEPFGVSDPVNFTHNADHDGNIVINNHVVTLNCD